MRANNVQLQIILGNEIKYSISPPAFFAGAVWDIGFLNAFNGEMMIINSSAEEMPQSRLLLSNEYFNLYEIISHCSNLKNMFGKNSVIL